MIISLFKELGFDNNKINELLKSVGIPKSREGFDSYKGINIYLSDFESGEIVDLNVKFRAGYPVNVTGLTVRAYDYYNPDVEGKTAPIEIKVNK